MNEKIAQEILHELFPAFEALETQSAALLQLLKDKGIANEEELAAHFEQAGKASSVRWLAVRVRIDYLLSSAMKTAEQDVQKESPKTTENPIAETSRERETHEDTLDIPKTAASSKPVADDTGAGAKKDQNQQGEEDSAKRVKKRQKMQPENPVGTDLLQKYYNHTNESGAKNVPLLPDTSLQRNLQPHQAAF